MWKNFLLCLLSGNKLKKFIFSGSVDTFVCFFFSVKQLARCSFSYKTNVSRIFKLLWPLQNFTIREKDGKYITQLRWRCAFAYVALRCAYWRLFVEINSTSFTPRTCLFLQRNIEIVGTIVPINSESSCERFLVPLILCCKIATWEGVILTHYLFLF